jgi:hypothetical protein
MSIHIHIHNKVKDAEGDVFQPGDKVLIKPQAYPNMTYEGKVLRKTPNGYSCQVNLNGFVFKETFSATRMTKT